MTESEGKMTVREEIAKLYSDAISQIANISPSLSLVRQWSLEFADQILSIKRIRIEAENQELPRLAPVAEGGAIESITKRAQQVMLTPKDDYVWVKCETK